MPRLMVCLLALAALVRDRPLPAQQSGVLLGVRLADSSQAYVTLWIAPQNGKVHLSATGPNLIVPRRSGFWRV